MVSKLGTMPSQPNNRLLIENEPGFPGSFASLVILSDYCFSYGEPSAAGGMARPTTPVSTMMVTI